MPHFLRMIPRVLLLLGLCLCVGIMPVLAAVHVKSALLVNMNTGKILYERNPDAQIAPASLTKLMTMFLTFDAIKAGRLKLREKVRVSKLAATVGGSVMRVNAGQSVPLVRLLAGTAVASGNDAAMALAEKVGGNINNFVRQMNKKAGSLGMRHTRYKNPTGLPAAGQKTTARDLWLLCKAYLKQHPQAARFHKMKNFLHRGGVTRNTNPLLGTVTGVIGLKTGWTVASGYNLIVTAERKGIRLLAIILGATDKQSRNTMALKLLEAGYNSPNSPGRVQKYMAGIK